MMFDKHNNNAPFNLEQSGGDLIAEHASLFDRLESVMFKISMTDTKSLPTTVFATDLCTFQGCILPLSDDDIEVIRRSIKAVSNVPIQDLTVILGTRIGSRAYPEPIILINRDDKNRTWKTFEHLTKIRSCLQMKCGRLEGMTELIDKYKLKLKQ